MNDTTSVYTVANVGPGWDTLTVTWTNLGPMTTPFTQPSPCSQPVPTNLNVFVSGTTYAPCDRTQSLDFPGEVCFATNRESLWDSPKPSNWVAQEHAMYYEPGVYCPEDWTTAMVMTTTAPNRVFWLNAEEPGWGPLGLPNWSSQTFCCPESWTLGGAAGCYSHITTSTSGAFCALPSTTITGIHMVPTQAQHVLTNDAAIQATAVYYSTTWVYTTPAVVLVGGNAATAIAPATTNTPLQEAQSNLSGLTMAVKIAIGIGVPLSVIGALIAGGVLLLSCRKRRMTRIEQEKARHDGISEVESFEAPPPAYSKY